MFPSPLGGTGCGETTLSEEMASAEFHVGDPVPNPPGMIIGEARELLLPGIGLMLPESVSEGGRGITAPVIVFHFVCTNFADWSKIALYTSSLKPTH